MFAKLVKSRAIDRRYVVSAPTVPVCSNDNRTDWRLADRARRPAPRVLACRWQVSPATGKLECHWAIEGAEAAPQEPEPNWSIIMRSAVRHQALVTNLS
jgi:hypothetical protein